MHTLQRPRPSWLARLIVMLAAVTSLTGVVGITPADASVINSCTISRCSDARSANATWASKGYPTTAAGTPGRRQVQLHWRPLPEPEGQLPAAPPTTSTTCTPGTGAARDAYRIVVNRSTGVIWFSPNHYATSTGSRNPMTSAARPLPPWLTVSTSPAPAVVDGRSMPRPAPPSSRRRRGSALSPGYFGRNWDALADSLRDATTIGNVTLIVDHAEDLLGAEPPEQFAILLCVLSGAAAPPA